MAYVLNRIAEIHRISNARFEHVDRVLFRSVVADADEKTRILAGREFYTPEVNGDENKVDEKAMSDLYHNR